MRILILLAALLIGPTASADDTFISGVIDCTNCGNPNTDWERYRNQAFNDCRWLRTDTPCAAALFERFAEDSEDRIRVNVCSTINSVLNTHGCQLVELWWDVDPGISIDIPWIDGEEGSISFGGEVECLTVRVSPPNGNTVDTVYSPWQQALSTLPLDLPYPPDHPWYEDGNGNACADANPVTTVMSLSPGRSSAPVRMRCPITLDRMEYVDGEADGFVREEWSVLGATPIASSSADAAATGMSCVGAATDDARLVLYHSVHPPNHRFMPDPLVTLTALEVDQTASGPVRGFVRIDVDRAGRVNGAEVLHADGALPKGLTLGIARSLEVRYQDDRRHRFAVYGRFEVEGGGVTLPETIVALPQCCGPWVPTCPRPGTCNEP